MSSSEIGRCPKCGKVIMRYTMTTDLAWDCDCLMLEQGDWLGFYDKTKEKPIPIDEVGVKREDLELGIQACVSYRRFVDFALAKNWNYPDNYPFISKPTLEDKTRMDKTTDHFQAALEGESG